MQEVSQRRVASPHALNSIRPLFLAIVAALLVNVPQHALPAELSNETLRLFLWQAPSTLNPHLAPGIKDQTASRIVYEPLASFDIGGNLVPFLAAEIPSIENGQVAPDGRSVTWKLRPDVKWSDGVPFTAKDVLFTYAYIVDKDVGSSSAGSYKSVEKVEALDDLTVKVTFKNVNPAWSLPFVGVQGMIIPEHVFAPYNNKNAADAPVNLAPVGTGPYRLKEFRTEDVLLIGEDVVNTVKIIFEPNPEYRDRDGLEFKEVTLQGGGDARTAANAVLSEGIVDYAWNLQVGEADLERLETKGVGKVVLYWGSYVERVMLNFTDPGRETADGERSSTQFPHLILTDRRVRQALAAAIDRQKIAELYGRTGRPSANLLVAPAPFVSQNTKWEFNLDKARALLDEAGWRDSDGDTIRDKGGVSLTLAFQTSLNTVREATQEIIKGDLAAIGVRMESKLIDSSIFLGSTPDNTNTRRHFYSDIEEFAYGGKSPDPGSYMVGWTCAEAAQKQNNWSGSNWARYCNADYDALFQASATEVDPEKRRGLFVAMNDLLISDAAVVPLVEWAYVSGLGNDIVGYDPTPWDAETWNIANWHRKK
ncbi:peptide ABC transporter substrate-binding protein [Mesorhizobium sangaii]|uniref:Peptide/nickel transport system substrate-binding protein n=1 Tax=Mesorhizobium sangaii TaxID=505389 RepID=A0A841PP42_9HYPH|nr:peptide ABC transporter substrate-binding protein [Mesorhizobium sangaii]MBB6411922.1 peptide/nickel transport system substrate-binding protein [Mesorhizobium sangaii]